MNVLSLEEGIERIFELADSVIAKPALICFYGPANSGKTAVRKECMELAREIGQKAGGGMIDDERSYFQNGHNLDYIFLEAYTDPLKHRSMEFIGRPIDISIAILNPRICRPAETDEIHHYFLNREYDILIINPFSKVKRCNSTKF